jgi:hypothetical protein
VSTSQRKLAISTGIVVGVIVALAVLAGITGNWLYSPILVCAAVAVVIALVTTRS